MTPATAYARSGDAHIAYQVVGGGPLDLVFVPGLVSHLDHYWEDPHASRFFERLASFSRLIVFDKRGTGLSDRDVKNATLEDRMDDVRAVMDAAGSERAALFGYSEGGPLSLLFTATYPERVSALVLAGTGASFQSRPGYPCSVAAAGAAFQDAVEERWGMGDTIELFAPSMAGSERARSAIARWERMASNPSAVKAFLDVFANVDMTPVLPTITVPSLVVQRTGDRIWDACHGRYMAEHIPGARYFEQQSDHHMLWLGPVDELVDEVEEFLTGARRPTPADRVLSTVLFTDVVGSTSQLAEVGDGRWRSVLDRHDQLVDRQIERSRGQLVKSTGDGALATFDGPARAVQCARAILDGAQDLGLSLRAGVHTGEVELRGTDVAGLAVHAAARIAAAAPPNEVLVSAIVPALTAGSGLEFEDHGETELKGLPDRWRLYRARA